MRVIIWGLYWDNGKENGKYQNRVYAYIIRGYIIFGIMEKKMETAIIGYIGFRV